MAEPIFDPLRVLAELNALGVRYVLAGELAAVAPTLPLDADRVELRIADDNDNIARLQLFLDALRAEELDASDDVHHAAFATVAGRIDCVEMPADGEFADLRARSVEVNFGHGVLARAVPPDTVLVVPRDARDLIGALRAASLNEEPSPALGSRRVHEDEYGPDVVLPEPGKKAHFRRVWKVFEDIDDFMNDLNERPLRKPRARGDS
jgi:hypothetical protein